MKKPTIWPLRGANGLGISPLPPVRAALNRAQRKPISRRISTVKVRCSLKSAKKRDKNCRIVRRKGRVYVINKRNPRFKARQG